MPPIEALLSARLFLQPHLVGDSLYFISDLSGRLSLYAMPYGGGLPTPLLPPHLALQNPHLTEPNHPYAVFPERKQLLVMLDQDGDEVYRPMLIPHTGGFPEPAFAEALAGSRVYLNHYDAAQGVVYLEAHDLQNAQVVNYQGRLETGELTRLYASPWGAGVTDVTPDHSQALLIEGYTAGDTVLLHWQAGADPAQVLLGTPLDRRDPAAPPPPLTNFHSAYFHGAGVLLDTALFDDRGGCAYLALDGGPDGLQPVAVHGLVHQGAGELARLERLEKDRYLLYYNIDGVSWLYEARFDPANLRLDVLAVMAGQDKLAGGVVESAFYDPESDSLVLSFSTAVSPTQLYTVETDRVTQTAHTHERLLGLDRELLAAGEDASYTSFDGLRISARLYLPAEKLGFQGRRPVVLYVHGGPHSQERPDFSWFSMALIQFLTLNGFAVFVPNVRGSRGYGLSFAKHVDRDWGGQDRLDHVHALTEVLPRDERLDVRRAAVVGRSYGGYMTLTLAARHPALWSAAVDMFGPYDLLTFMERIPATWRPYFHLVLGDPAADRDFLVERSPRAHIDNLACPLLVIQGANDPRVVARESQDLVEQLRAQGKDVEYLLFGDEGHDMLKFANKARAYRTITDFLIRHLAPGEPTPPPAAPANPPL